MRDAPKPSRRRGDHRAAPQSTARLVGCRRDSMQGARRLRLSRAFFRWCA
jgi:hypothetical protein